MINKIRVDTYKDAVEFSSIAEALKGDIKVTDNKGQIVNAKSLLGMLYALEFDSLTVISDEDMELLKNIEHIKDYGESSFFPVFGGKF